jgi:fumarate hydratase class II
VAWTSGGFYIFHKPPGRARRAKNSHLALAEQGPFDAAMETRTETDALGAVQVPADRYWGAQTQRALENFPIGQTRFPPEVIRALGLVKKAAAQADAELGVLDWGIAALIARAADEVIEGKWNDHFPLTIWQTGSGTQTNMNANEVIANRAIELVGGELGSKKPVHPNDHVNCGQSSNDVFPTIMHLAAAEALHCRLAPALEGLARTFAGKAASFARIVKVGRTHLQDDLPLSLGQELSGHAAQLEQAVRRARAALVPLYRLALGGTAVGTGLNAHPDFAQRAAATIARLTGLPFVSAPNKFEALSACDALVETSSQLRTLAASLLKIANDIRWLASGPRCGIGELEIPVHGLTSSIMPGKTNPVHCEVLVMVCLLVMGHHAAMGFAGASGHFQLNTCRPLILHNALESIHLLTDACRAFDQRCAQGIMPRRERLQDHLEGSLALAGALAPHIGRDQAARLAAKAFQEGKTLKQAAAELGLLSPEQFDALVRPENLLGPQSAAQTFP